jgi:hypothetical protein
LRQTIRRRHGTFDPKNRLAAGGLGASTSQGEGVSSMSISEVKQRANAVGREILCQGRRNWRLLVGAAIAGATVYWAIELSDYQGRYDIPSAYAVKMTCEPDPESVLWSGGCDRVAADIARTDKPSFFALYRAFVTVHHRQIPSPQTSRRFADVPCDPTFDRDATLKGTRFILEPVRVRFTDACTLEHAQAIMAEIDKRDRALLVIGREGLSHEALLAGALANLTEPLVIFGGAVILAALLIL